MFALVALLCLYLGINNVRNAFRLASENGWQRISVLLIITGIILLALVSPASYRRPRTCARRSG